MKTILLEDPQVRLMIGLAVDRPLNEVGIIWASPFLMPIKQMYENLMKVGLIPKRRIYYPYAMQGSLGKFSALWF